MYLPDAGCSLSAARGGLGLNSLIFRKGGSGTGRKNKEYAKDLHQQAYEKLTAMQAFGQSKREAAADGQMQDKIFSYNTYKTYWKHTKYFIRYIQSAHPECTTLKSAKKYVNEWLRKREEQGLSAWTVQTEAKALGKLYGITPDDELYYQPPKRERGNIKRSRGEAKRDAHFSEANNAELIAFCRGTGLRRSELELLHGDALLSREQIVQQRMALTARAQGLDIDEKKALGILDDALLFDTVWYLRVKGKGGRVRISPVIGKYADKIAERVQETPTDKRVWEYVSSNADIHSYRADYAGAIYKAYARAIEDIPYDGENQGTGRKFQKDVYTCRGDEAKKKLDKAAMLLCSKALGHNRLSIVADNYLRNL